jgi:hypothetical protein
LIAYVVYSLCALTSVLCAVLLGRAYRRSRVRLLMWSTWCFVGLALNNILLLTDKLSPGIDLSLLRAIPALVGVSLLVWGLIRETA